MKRKRVELTDEIVRCAREFVNDQHAIELGPTAVRYQALRDAVAALDAYGPSEIVGGRGSWVEGSPPASEMSAHLISPRTKSLRRQVIDQIAVAMWQAGGAQRGLTCAELCGRLGRKHQSVSSVVNWAELAGWIMPSGFQRDATPGHPAIVYCLTPAALAKRGER